MFQVGPAAAATLVVDAVAPGAVTHDLSALGTADWKHFGRDAVSTVNRKAGAPELISDYTQIGSTPVARFSARLTKRQSVSWNDGKPQSTESATATGLYFRGQGGGYELTLPADTNVRTARVFLGGWSARGRLQVSLSDGSAAQYTKTFENASGIFDRAVTITYSAGSAGQTLTIRFVIVDKFDGGNITLSAVALAGASVSQPPVLDPIGDRTVRVGETLTIDVSSRDADGPSPLVLDARPLPGTARFDDLGSGNGRFEWTPQPGDESATPYSVTFSAAEDNGAGGATEETIGITVQPVRSSGILLADAVAPGAVTHDLTALGTADWKHFGRDAVSTVNRKVGAPELISDYTQIGSRPVARFNARLAKRQSVRWDDGKPQSTESATASGLYFRGKGGGYELTLPADTNVRTARVYLGGWKARGRLVVRLSDGSAAQYTKTFENANGVFDRAVTITYSAASAGQTLTLRYVIEDPFDDGNITLSAVALAGAGVNRPPVLDPIGDRTVRVGETLTIDVSSRDADGPSPLVLDARPLLGTARFDDLGSGNGRFEWTPQPGDASATPYSVTFSAAENNGAGAATEETIGITVQEADGQGDTNSPPAISGQPNGEAEAGTPWAFTPAASDPDGDMLTFVIQNRPVWARFDTANGRLSGTPADSHVGTYPDIRISVTDGQVQTSLPAFAINVGNPSASTGSVELHWTPPTSRVDGSPLGNLAGYRIYRGSSMNDLKMVREVNNPGITSFLMEGLTAGQWHFGISAVDGNGGESALSNIVSRWVN